MIKNIPMRRRFKSIGSQVSIKNYRFKDFVSGKYGKPNEALSMFKRKRRQSKTFKPNTSKIEKINNLSNRKKITIKPYKKNMKEINGECYFDNKIPEKNNQCKFSVKLR